MALKLHTTYPGRFDSPSENYPQGKWRNRSNSTAHDGGYLEEKHMNDIYGFFGALLRNAEMSPNGEVDTAKKSQFYNALVVVAKKAVGEEYRKLDDNVFDGYLQVRSEHEGQGTGVFLQDTDGTVRGQVVATDQGLQLTQYPKDGGLQTFTFPSEGGEVIVNSTLRIVTPHMFGAKGDGVSDDTTALQQAFDYASSENVTLYIPKGTYLHSDTIHVGSNTKVLGAGSGNTTLKNISINSRTDNLRIDFKDSVQISGLYLDGNWHARDIKESVGDGYGGCNLLIRASQNIEVEDVVGAYPHKHCFDVTGESYSTDGGNPEVWVKNTSHNIRITRCKAIGGGDDNFTTHQCYNVWFDNCESYYPEGQRYVQNNNNGLEIDDGSRYVYVDNFYAIGGYEGIQVKAHSNAPAPHNIYINNAVLVNNHTALEIRHTSFYGENSNYSKSAKNVFIDGLHIINPAVVNSWLHEDDSRYDLPEFGIHIRSYDNVSINNVTFDFNSSVANGIDIVRGQKLQASPIRVGDGARNISINNININVDDWVIAPNKAIIYGSKAGTYNISVKNVIINNLLGNAIYFTSTVDNVSIENVIINSLHHSYQNEEMAYPIVYIGGSNKLLMNITSNVLDKSIYDIVPNYNNLITSDIKRFKPNDIRGFHGMVGDNGWLRIGCRDSSNSGVNLRLTSDGNVSHYFDGNIVGIQSTTSGGKLYGNLIPNRTSTIDIGEEENSFRNIFLSNQPVVSSDLRLKYDIEEIDDKYFKVMSKLNFRQFKIKSDISDIAHFGIIAQDWIDACNQVDVDPHESGVLVGTEETGYAIRYAELMVLHNAYLSWRLEQLGG